MHLYSTPRKLIFSYFLTYDNTKKNVMERILPNHFGASASLAYPKDKVFADYLKLPVLLLVFLSMFYVENLNAQCTVASYGSFGSLTPTCTGAYQNVTTCGYRGEYSTITVTAKCLFLPE